MEPFLVRAFSSYDQDVAVVDEMILGMPPELRGRFVQIAEDFMEDSDPYMKVIGRILYQRMAKLGARLIQEDHEGTETE